MKTTYSSFLGVKACLAILLSCLLALGPGLGNRVFAAREQGQVPLKLQAAAGGFHISGRSLLDANGNTFVMRGINHPHNWYSGQTSSFGNIKAKGSNTIRVVLGSGHRFPKNSAANVANVINLCKTNKLVCVLEVHDTTGYMNDPAASSLAEAVAYWKEIKSVLIGQEAYVMINIGNEPWGNKGATGWITDTKNAILELRNAGFQHTLIVDAPNWGQDWQFIMRDNAASILASDPNKNILFSVHMYGIFDTADKIESYLSTFVKANLPLIIGEFGYSTTTTGPDEDAIMQKADAYQIGYLGWSWSGNSNPILDMVTKFDPNQETWWGNRIIHGVNGICQTSVEASIYGGSGVPTGCSAGPKANVKIASTDKGIFSLGAGQSLRQSFAGTDDGPVKVSTSDGSTSLLSSERFIYSYQNSKAYAEMMGYPDSQLTTEYWFPWYNNVSYSTQLRISNMGTGTAQIKVYAGGAEIDSFSLGVGQAQRTTYAVNQGPLHVVSTDGTTKILVSERFIQTFGSSASYSEMMGYPGDKLATEYWFPWYSNKTYSTQLRVSNMGGKSADVKVYAGSSLVDTFTLTAGEARRIAYDGVDSGPLHVVSTDGVTPILASERFILTFGSSASYAEMMGYPGNQLATQYCFPWYNNTTDNSLLLSSQLRVSNMGAGTAQIKVNLAGSQIDSFSLNAGQGMRKTYASFNNGPLCVVSADGITPILASERFISTYLNSASYSEMMGYPRNRLDDIWWFPWYNNISYQTELRMAKP